MKKMILLTFLIGLTVSAETYEAPAMEKVEWKKPKVKVYKDIHGPPNMTSKTRKPLRTLKTMM